MHGALIHLPFSRLPASCSRFPPRMFLHACLEELLPFRAETHIVKGLPAKVARKLATTLVKHLDEAGSSEEAAFLTTPAHV